ncbi:hypothetical protein [Nocardia fluminea]|uniref:hypothetical protein n=1 Tax=Nocardia fluminea TaxID=134984 RepID=UPI003663278B
MWARISRREFLLMHEDCSFIFPNQGNFEREISISMQILHARDDFLAWMSSADSDNSFPAGRTNSLWEYFSCWLEEFVDCKYIDRDTHFWLDDEISEVVLNRFLRLVPTVYVAVLDSYLRNPSVVNVVREDAETGEAVTVEREITSFLPEGDSSLTTYCRHREDNDSPPWGKPCRPTPEGEAATAALVSLLSSETHNWPIAKPKKVKHRK